MARLESAVLIAAAVAVLFAAGCCVACWNHYVRKTRHNRRAALIAAAAMRNHAERPALAAEPQERPQHPEAYGLDPEEATT
jgi:hypothetical protein